MTPVLATAPGFTDPPRDSQRVFRAVMNALARPTTLQPLAASLASPSPLTGELAAVALALCDGDAPLWLDPLLAEAPAVAAYLRFHSGAPVVADPAEALFALVADSAGLLPLDRFALGTQEFPDRSTTVVIAVAGFDGLDAITVEGPGLQGRGTVAPHPLPLNFRDRWRANRAVFPRGVDLLFVGAGQVAALPRSSRLVGGA